MITLTSNGRIQSTVPPFVPPMAKTSGRNKPGMTLEKIAMHDRGLTKIYAIIDRFKP